MDRNGSPRPTTAAGGRRRVLLARRSLLAAPVALLARPARAAWPERPVRLVAPFPPGSGTDVLARLLAPTLSRELGQPVVVDNRPGGNGIVGAQSVATGATDGYTLLILGTSAAAITPHTLKRVPYDATRDFAMVGAIAQTPYVLCTHAEGPRDLGGLVDYIRGRNGNATFSYGNAGSLIMAAVLGNMTGLPVTPVAYRGGAEAITEVGSGRIDFNFSDFGPAKAQAESGRIRMLAHSMARPFAVAPDLPSLSTVLPGFDMSVWWSIAVAAGTPAPIVTRASQALEATLSSPEVVERLHAIGDIPLHMTPAEMTQFVARERDVWGERVRIAGIQPE